MSNFRGPFCCPVCGVDGHGDKDTWTDKEGLEYREIISKSYKTGIISTGFVENHPDDTVYLKLRKDGEEGWMMLLTPDEMASIAMCASGALVCVTSNKRSDDEEETEV